MEHYLQKVINFEAGVFEGEIRERLDRISDTINKWKQFQELVDNIVMILEELCDMGFSNEAVGRRNTVGMVS